MLKFRPEELSLSLLSREGSGSEREKLASIALPEIHGNDLINVDLGVGSGQVNRSILNDFADE